MVKIGTVTGSSACNRIRRPRIIYALLFLLLVAAIRAKSVQALPDSGVLTGSVAGTVVIEGTKEPVSFARVILVPEPANLAASDGSGQTEPAGPQKPHLQEINGRTELDGTFRLDGVPVGDYFVGAVSPGLIGPYAMAGSFASDVQLKKLLPSWPTVHVAARQVATADLSMRRGGVISGTVRYADGRPARGLPVGLEIAERDLALESVRLAKITPLQHIAMYFDYYTTHRRESDTDDEGRFRIYGLAPGNYLVSTVLFSPVGGAAQIMMSDGSSPTPDRPGTAASSIPEMTAVYAPGVFRRGDAKIIRIHGSDAASDVDLKIDPGGLPSVRGKLVAGGDRHAPSDAFLVLQEDGGEAVGRYAGIKTDGSFAFDYVSPGNYTLQLRSARDVGAPAVAYGVPQVTYEYRMPDKQVVVETNNVDLGEILLAPK
jgi:hypothetical protein